MNNNIEKIKEHIEKFGSSNGMEREKARFEILKFGSEAKDLLLELLDHPKHIYRWEAMQTLKEIKDRSLIPVFIELMEHEESDIRWLSYEGLSNQGKNALEPVLDTLFKKSNSVFVLAGVHHYLKDLMKQKSLPEDFPYDEIMPMLLQTGYAEKLKTTALKAKDIL